MTPLRLLLVTETYPPEINGVAMTTQRLVQGLGAVCGLVGHNFFLFYGKVI